MPPISSSAPPSHIFRPTYIIVHDGDTAQPLLAPFKSVLPPFDNAFALDTCRCCRSHPPYSIVLLLKLFPFFRFQITFQCNQQLDEDLQVCCSMLLLHPLPASSPASL